MTKNKTEKALDKFHKLKNNISTYKSAIIAFSGGVDSTFLAFSAREAIGRKAVLLVTATSSTYPFYELEESKHIAKFLKLPQKIIKSEEIDIPGFSQNPSDRCYYCKSELFTLIKHIADKEGYEIVFDGSNADDLDDYRPGRKAIKELGIISPLCEAGLTKNEIRIISKKNNLPTANKPSYACLASRFPYGEQITKKKLERVGKTEFELRKLGFNQFRIRSHNDLARIEFAKDELEKGWAKRKQILNLCKKAGFVYVSIDIEGYRTGAMNESL